MGRSTRKKQEELAEREQNFVTQLVQKRAFRSPNPKRAVTAQSEGILNDAIKKYKHLAIRPIDKWVYAGKSRKIEKQRLDLIRYAFGRYPVPKFLEDIIMNQRASRPEDAGKPLQAPIYTDWYIAVALGQSLYKTCTRDVLSKRETHLLLQAPSDLDICEAVWWAKTMAVSDNIGVSYRMTRSPFPRNVGHVYDDKFWIDVHRFFTVNNVSIKEMAELFDYIRDEHFENKNWTINKRSLESVRRKSEEWHRAQYKRKTVGGGSWRGMEDIPTWEHTTGKFNPNPQKNTKTEWTITQILTGNGLHKEGQAMRHCVTSYKGRCMSGDTAIFSMTSETPVKGTKRNLTIEVNVNTRRIWQVRGYSNRLARPQEKEVLTKWAKANRLRIESWY